MPANTQACCRSSVGPGIALLALAAVTLNAQEPQPEPEAQVQLSFPEQTDLVLLVDYVSERLGIKILYDEQVANKRISVKAPEKIPADSLLPLLESALKIKGLALVDADIAGWKQIVPVKDLTQIARPTEPGSMALEGLENSTAVTQAFALRFIDPEKLATIVKPFLTEPGASTITLPERKLLIITDYAGNLQRIAKLVDTIDQAGPPSTLRFYQVRHLEAQALAQRIREVFAARAKADASVTSPLGQFEVSQDERTNQLLIVAPEKLTEEILALAQSLDVPLGTRTEVYSFQYVAAERIDRLVKELFDPLIVDRLYRSAIDGDDNLLIVTAPDDIHEQVVWLRKEMDVESKRPGSSVQFYKLKNATAEEVLATLLSIQQTSSSTQLSDYSQTYGTSVVRGVSPLGRGPTGAAGYSLGVPLQNQFSPGPNYPATPGQEAPTEPPAMIPEAQPSTGQSGIATADAAALAFASDAVRLTADQFTNSIIVIGDRNVQAVYKNLIEFLDKKRPQVMIEARVVIIDTSDNYSLGVEFSAGDRTGAKRLFEFTSYGLSQVNPASGALTIIPGRGFNFTLVDPTVADAVLRALATHRRARVLSAPRVLVNDNSTGTLASVTEVPFTSVNASNTVATTSFAGFAEAGTTIEVLPRISDDDHLVLEYVVTLNSFTGEGGAGVPPPRQTDEVRSTVTIPDGHTVIVGGLNRSNSSLSQEGIPFLENIPLVRELTSLRSTSKSTTTLYVFLRPVIVRDDKFRDLRYLSDQDLKRADCRTNFPASAPLLIR